MLWVTAASTGAAASTVAAASTRDHVAASTKRRTRDRPNVLLFFVDDLGYGNLQSTGDPAASTPSIDRLTAQGRRLPNWYSGYPVCSASRTALLTGRQPPRVGMVGVINSLTASGLPLSEVTVAEEMSAAGYSTLALGKWHQGQLPEYLPAARGFDEFLGLPFSVDDGQGYLSSCESDGAEITSAALDAASIERPRGGYGYGSALGPLLPLPLIRQAGRNVSEIVEQPTDLRLLTSRLLQHAVGFVDAQRTKPFFVYFAFGHVHTATENISPDRQYSGCGFVRRTPRPFHDALAEVDDAIGMLVGHVASLGLAEHTLTLFTSDNGPSLRWEGGAGSVGPFVGASARFANGTAYTNTGKGSTWEGGIRMPAFVHWPGTVPPQTSAHTTVSTLDVLPSLLHLIGRTPSASILDGTLSLADAILAPSAARGSPPSRHTFLPFYNEPAYGNASHRIFAARFGRYKVHWITSPGLGGGLLPYKSPTPEWDHHAQPLVFDVEADPGEQFALSDEALPPTLLQDVAVAKAAYEAGLTPTSIDPAWGYEHALCCGIGCVAPCECKCQGVPLPIP